MDDCCSDKGCELEALAQRADRRRVLVAVLALNATMFLVQSVASVFANSTSLLADAGDMLGDAFVYALSLYALNRSVRWKAGAALVKGALIVLFGLLVIAEAVSKAVNNAPPASGLMLTFGALALAVNLGCLTLLWRFRGEDVNMASTFECSRNDVVANVGVLLAAVGVALLKSPWPDILVGLAIAALFLRSAVRVVRTAWSDFKTPPPPPAATFTITPRHANASPR
jgi:cation diffusion facilitator family transporter